MLITYLKRLNLIVWVIITIYTFKATPCYLRMSLKILEKLVLKHCIISLPGLAWQACLKKTGVELELLTDYDMLLMIKEGIRGGICHAVHRYAKANNKYMKNYDKSKESSYIQYLDANNLYGAAMSEKLPINGFKWVNDISKIDKKYVKSYDKKDSDKGYILEVDFDCPSKLHKLHSDMPFLPERMKIDKTQKLVCNLHDKKKYVVHISILKQALDHGLKLSA